MLSPSFNHSFLRFFFFYFSFLFSNRTYRTSCSFYLFPPYIYIIYIFIYINQIFFELIIFFLFFLKDPIKDMNISFFRIFKYQIRQSQKLVLFIFPFYFLSAFFLLFCSDREKNIVWFENKCFSVYMGGGDSKYFWDTQ